MDKGDKTMKAKVKGTEKIVEIIGTESIYLKADDGGMYLIEELEGIESDLDYWTRLEHQYAGMAMQGLLSNPSITERELTTRKGIVEDAERLAHALVQKLKEKEETK